MLKRIYLALTTTISVSFKSVYRIYPLSALLLLWLYMLINGLIWDYFEYDSDMFLLCVFLVNFGLMIESFSIARLHFAINIFLRIVLLVIAFFVMLGLLVGRAVFSHTMGELACYGCIMICFILFVGQNLTSSKTNHSSKLSHSLESCNRPSHLLFGNSFYITEARGFYQIVSFGSMILAFFFLFVILVCIFFGSVAFLFDMRGDSIFQLIGSSILLLGYISSLVFLGNMKAIKDNTKQEISHRTQTLSLIFNVFAYLYAGLLIIYFGLYFLGNLNNHSSVVHLVLWFSLFGIVLVWLNDGIGKQYQKKLFLVILVIFALIALYSIALRIGQYGITPNRYFVLLASVFVLLSALYMFINYRIWYILCVLCVMIGIGTLSPYNAISLSIASQKARYANANYEDQQSIEMLLRQLENVDNDTEVVDSIHRKPAEHFFYFTGVNTTDDQNIEIIGNISGFDTMLWIQYKHNTDSKSWEDSGYRLEIQRNGYSIGRFSLYQGEKVILRIDDMNEALKMITNKNMLNIEQNGRRFRFVILGASGFASSEKKDKNYPKDALKINDITAILLIQN